MHQLSSLASRILFGGASLLAVVAIMEKFANISGRTLTFVMGQAPMRMLEYAAVALLFVIAIQLREMNHASR